MTGIVQVHEVAALVILIGGPVASAASAYCSVKYALRGMAVVVERMEKTLYRGNGDVGIVTRVHEQATELARLGALVDRHAADIERLREQTLRLTVEGEADRQPIRAATAAAE